MLIIKGEYYIKESRKAVYMSGILHNGYVNICFIVFHSANIYYDLRNTDIVVYRGHHSYEDMEYGQTMGSMFIGPVYVVKLERYMSHSIIAWRFNGIMI
jgi:hypothetical protein